MKTNLKRITSGLLALLAMFSLAACGGDGGTAKTTELPAVKQQRR